MVAPFNLDDPTGRRLYAVGLGVVGSATVLGGLLWLIRRQVATGDVVKITLVHELDPETRALGDRYLPSVRKLADEGMRVRLFGRPDRDEDILGALAPTTPMNRFSPYLF